MKKAVRRFISLIASLALICSLTMPAFAATTATYWGEDSPVEVEPRVYEVCNGKSYHEMVSHCWGTGFVNNKTYVEGCAWQCSGCNYVMVTEGDPLLDGGIIGKWAGAAWGEKLNTVTYVYLYAEDYGVRNSAKMSGYKFVNSTY